MELRHLRALVAVAEERHFGRAAQRLHISQPPLSAAVRELERELGVTLFERTTRSVQITPTGEQLLESARAALRAVEQVSRTAQGSRDGEIGTVRAGFGGTAGYELLARLVRRVREQAPGITIELVPQMYSGTAVAETLDGALDLALTGVRPPRGLDSVVISHETLVLAVPGEHPLAARQAIEPRDLAGVPLVVYPPEQGSWVLRATMTMLQDADVAIEVAAEAPDPFSMLALVSAGVGPAVVVDGGERIRVDGVRYLPFSGATHDRFPLRLAWHPTRSNPAVRRVVDVARELFAAGQAPPD